jgi:hypothetical protein
MTTGRMRPLRPTQGWQALAGGGEKADHFVDRLGLHAQRDGERTEFEIGNRAVEHRAVELLRLGA